MGLRGVGGGGVGREGGRWGEDGGRRRQQLCWN